MLQRTIGKASRPVPKVSQPEAATLADVRAYCDDENIEHFHIPGWLLAVFGMLHLVVTAVLEHARDSAEEVRGFPDLILFYRGRFCALELKTEIGKMTHAQQLWQKRLGTIQCRSTAAAVCAIAEWKVICES